MLVVDGGAAALLAALWAVPSLGAGGERRCSRSTTSPWRAAAAVALTAARGLVGTQGRRAPS